MLRSTEVLERSRKLELEDKIAASGIHKTHLLVTALTLSKHWHYRLFRDVEQVVSGIRHADFLADVRSVAAGRWRFATFGVEALDSCGARKHAGAVVAQKVDEKPGNGIGVRRRRIGNGFASDAAAVVRFPGRSREMFAERFAILVEELGIGSFQRPRELCAVGLAGVDLGGLRIITKKKLVFCGRFAFLQGVVGRGVGRR